MRNFHLGVNMMFTEVFKKTNCKANCNLEPDEYTMQAATKHERSTMCLVHSTRCRPYECWNHSFAASTVNFWVGGRSSTQLRNVYLSLWLTFVDRELTSNRWEDAIDRSVECAKRLHF